MVSHVDLDDVKDMNKKLKDELAKDITITMHRIRAYHYLDMPYSDSGLRKVHLTMFRYIYILLNEPPVDKDGFASTLAVDHLFSIDPNPELIDKRVSDIYHHNVTKTLFFVTMHVQICRQLLLFEPLMSR